MNFNGVGRLLQVCTLNDIPGVFIFSAVRLPFILSGLSIYVPRCSPTLVTAQGALCTIKEYRLKVINKSHFIVNSFYWHIYVLFSSITCWKVIVQNKFCSSLRATFMPVGISSTRIKRRLPRQRLQYCFPRDPVRHSQRLMANHRDAVPVYTVAYVGQL